MDDWKELEIGNIPGDFFVNERYEIEYYEENSVKLFYHEWKSCSENVLARVKFVDHCQSGDKYRYRLKPLESMKVSQKVYDYLLDKLLEDHANGGEFEYSVSRFDDDNPWKIDNIEGQKVQIIGEME